MFNWFERDVFLVEFCQWTARYKVPLRYGWAGLPSGKAVRLVSRGTSVRIRFGSHFSLKIVVCGHCPVTLSLTINETLKWLSSPPIWMQESFWWWQCSDKVYNLPLPPPPYPLPPFSPSLISRTVSVDIKHNVYLLRLLRFSAGSVPTPGQNPTLLQCQGVSGGGGGVSGVVGRGVPSPELFCHWSVTTGENNTLVRRLHASPHTDLRRTYFTTLPSATQ